MSERTTAVSRDRCPVCGGGSRPLLALPAQPIYQHPLSADAVVPKPHTVDLTWVACADCAHGWQPSFDAGLLKRIYRQHYYTPMPDGMAVQFRNDFISAMKGFGLAIQMDVLLEIGASNGDVLAELKARTRAVRAYAFEPDAQNAARARERGLEVCEQFFGTATARDLSEAADLVYARHVIEHVFDFRDFFVGVDAVIKPETQLVLETPSLDHHVGTAALNPFHIEHVHVFSLRSLARLTAAHGWRLKESVLTAGGNLIACFDRVKAFRNCGADSMPSHPKLDGIQERLEMHRGRMRSLLAHRRLIFWGAGSAAVRLASLIGRPPDYWTDGNPAKIGKKFVGFDCPILGPAEAISAAAADASSEPILVIASSYLREILPQVRDLGWQGETMDLSGNTL